MVPDLVQQLCPTHESLGDADDGDKDNRQSLVWSFSSSIGETNVSPSARGLLHAEIIDDIIVQYNSHEELIETIFVCDADNLSLEGDIENNEHDIIKRVNGVKCVTTANVENEYQYIYLGDELFSYTHSDSFMDINAAYRSSIEDDSLPEGYFEIPTADAYMNQVNRLLNVCLSYDAVTDNAFQCPGPLLLEPRSEIRDDGDFVGNTGMILQETVRPSTIQTNELSIDQQMTDLFPVCTKPSAACKDSPAYTSANMLKGCDDFPNVIVKAYHEKVSALSTNESSSSDAFIDNILLDDYNHSDYNHDSTTVLIPLDEHLSLDNMDANVTINFDIQQHFDRVTPIQIHDNDVRRKPIHLYDTDHENSPAVLYDDDHESDELMATIQSVALTPWSSEFYGKITAVLDSFDKNADTEPVAAMQNIWASEIKSTISLEPRNEESSMLDSHEKIDDISLTYQEDFTPIRVLLKENHNYVVTRDNEIELSSLNERNELIPTQEMLHASELKELIHSGGKLETDILTIPTSLNVTKFTHCGDEGCTPIHDPESTFILTNLSVEGNIQTHESKQKMMDTSESKEVIHPETIFEIHLPQSIPTQIVDMSPQTYGDGDYYGEYEETESISIITDHLVVGSIDAHVLKQEKMDSSESKEMIHSESTLKTDILNIIPSPIADKSSHPYVVNENYGECLWAVSKPITTKHSAVGNKDAHVSKPEMMNKTELEEIIYPEHILQINVMNILPSLVDDAAHCPYCDHESHGESYVPNSISITRNICVEKNIDANVSRQGIMESEERMRSENTYETDAPLIVRNPIGYTSPCPYGVGENYYECQDELSRDYLTEVHVNAHASINETIFSSMNGATMYPESVLELDTSINLTSIDDAASYLFGFSDNHSQLKDPKTISMTDEDESVNADVRWSENSSYSRNTHLSLIQSNQPLFESHLLRHPFGFASLKTISGDGNEQLTNSIFVLLETKCDNIGYHECKDQRDDRSSASTNNSASHHVLDSQDILNTDESRNGLNSEILSNANPESALHDTTCIVQDSSSVEDVESAFPSSLHTILREDESYVLHHSEPMQQYSEEMKEDLESKASITSYDSKSDVEASSKEPRRDRQRAIPAYERLYMLGKKKILEKRSSTPLKDVMISSSKDSIGSPKALCLSPRRVQPHNLKSHSPKGTCQSLTRSPKDTYRNPTISSKGNLSSPTRFPFV